MGDYARTTYIKRGEKSTPIRQNTSVETYGFPINYEMVDNRLPSWRGSFYKCSIGKYP